METENEVVAVNGSSMTTSGESGSTKSGTRTHILQLTVFIILAAI